MKQLILLFAALSVGLTTLAQTTYYTCAVAPSTTRFLTTDPAGGGTCNVDSAVWNAPGNTVVVLQNTSYFEVFAPVTVEADIQVDSAGTMTLKTQGGNKSIPFKSGTSFRIFGTVNTAPNLAIVNNGYLYVAPSGTLDNSGSANNNVTISGSGTALIEGTVIAGDEFIVDGNVVLTGSLVGDVFIVDGSITGSGTVTGNTSLTGTGTINGVGIANVTSPVNLANTGFKWNGTNWEATTNAASTKASVGATDKAFIDGVNYATSSGNLTVADLQVSSGKLTIEAGDSVVVSSRLINNDSIHINNHGILSPNAISSTGTGTFFVQRSFSRIGWHHISFPTKGTNTMSDLSATGFGLDLSGTSSQNLFTWDASSSSWSYPSSSTLLAKTPIALYVDATNSSVTLPIANGDFNVKDVTVAIDYHNPGAVQGDSTLNGTDWSTTSSDGWNFIAHPFQTYVNWNALTLSNINSAVYVFDGTSYKSFTQSGAGDPEAQYLSPHQAFFVQSNGSTGTLLMDNAAGTSTPGNFSNLFKQQPELYFQAFGAGDTVGSWVTEHVLSTDEFDGYYDAFHVASWSDAAELSSTNTIDSVAYHIQTAPKLDELPLFLSFTYSVHGEPFTLQLSNEHSGYYDYVYCTDLFTGNTINLKEEPLHFTHDSLAPKQRFRLTVSNDATTSIAEGNEHANRIWFDGLNIQSNIPPSEIKSAYCYRSNGQMIAQVNNLDGLTIPDQRGIYIIGVHLNSGSVVHTKVVQ